MYVSNRKLKCSQVWVFYRLIAIKALTKQKGELYILFFQAIPGGKDGMKRSSQSKIVNGLKYMHLWTTLNQRKKILKGIFMERLI